MILICSAWNEEIKYLKESENFLVRELGIGFLDAALNLEELIHNHAKSQGIEQVIFIGTAGLYQADQDLSKELVEIESVELLNLGKKLELSYSPQSNKSYSSSLELNSGLPKAKCFSSLEISQDKAIAEKVINAERTNTESPKVQNNNQILVENMELYGLAKVCDKHKIPWSSLLGITNRIDKEAHQEWQANHQELSQKLCSFIESSFMTVKN